LKPLVWKSARLNLQQWLAPELASSEGTESHGAGDGPPPAPPGAPLGVVVAALAAMLGAWIAAGSSGLLAQPLECAMTWTAATVAVIAVGPRGKRLLVVLLGAGVMIALGVLFPSGEVHGVLSIALVVALLVPAEAGPGRQVLLITAVAVLALGVYRLAYTSIPTVWLLADGAGLFFGRAGSAISGRPLCVGATFGGIDLLVLMGGVYAGWLWFTAAPRPARAIWGVLAILAGHLLYLILLSLSTDLADALPPVPPPEETRSYTPPDWSWSDAVRTLLPWNMPALGVAIQLAIAGAMFRWARWRPIEQGPAPAVGSPRLGQALTRFGPRCLAILVPILVSLSLGGSDLSGKKLIVHEEGYLNWLKPEHGSYGRESAGMYGMLPSLVRSLGGSLRGSSDLAAEELADADVLLLLHPAQPWPREQLERIWAFVRGGGSLLLVAEPEIRKGGSASSFNEVLASASTGMVVRQDVAISQTVDWQGGLQPLAHPTTLGVDDRPARLGMVAGSSIRTQWPARPILVGRWGWSDPGSDAALRGLRRYDPGEKLGDLVLVAERRLGKGRLVVLADAFSLTNEGMVTAYPFAGRLLGYLANRSASPQAWWRQTLGLLACLMLVGLFGWRPSTMRLAGVSILLAASLAISAAASHRAGSVLPRSRASTPREPKVSVAYIDASHLEAYSEDGWSADGIAGLGLTLMRNGYLPFSLAEFTRRRLQQAEMLISIAPSRRFSKAERELVSDLVNSGGILVSTVGAEDARPSRPLLEQFDFYLAPSPVGPSDSAAENEPMGHYPNHYGRFATEYLNAADYGQGDYKARVWVHAGWPVGCTAADVEILCRGFDDLPLIIARRVGSGRVVLIGDSGFAMNKNLEAADGEPLNGGYENAHFWRWLFSRLSDSRKEWIPPPPPADDESAVAESPGQAAAARSQDRRAPDDASRDEVAR